MTSPGGIVSEVEFGRMLVAERTAMLGYAKSMTRDLDRARDLVQDTIVLALRGRESFLAGSNFRGWLWMVMRNRHYSLSRRAARQMPWSDGFLAYRADPARPDITLEAKQAVAAIAKLRPKHAAVIGRAADGETMVEMAEGEGVSIGTIKSRLFRGRQALEELTA